MSDQSSWFNEDVFWELFEPVLFNQQRQALAREQVDKIEKLVQLGKSDLILDLCCGNGRHTLELSARGFSVTGVDRTRSYIGAARSRAVEKNLKALFIVGDMRNYRSPKGYDVILNLFGSFGYFEDAADDRRVIQNMHDSLRRGGRLLVETMGKEILARDFQVREWHEEGDLLILSEKKIIENWGRVQTRWIVIRDGERFEHRVSIRSYSAVELSTLFESCGFSEVKVYGNLDGIEYDQEAQRLVVVGYK